VSKQKAVTILDVARLAGVSKTTASDALSNSGRVSDGTRASVLDAADRLGYSPNAAARHLRTGSTGTIGVYVPDSPTRSPYFMEFVMGVLSQTAEEDLDLTILTGGAGSGRRRIPRVDGIILADPADGDRFVNRVIDSDIPVVTGEAVLSGAAVDGVVKSGYLEAIIALLDHMRDQGSRRPGIVLPEPDRDWARQLRRGYDDWCVRSGTTARVQHLPFAPSPDAVRRACTRLLTLQPGIDGLITAPSGTVGPALAALAENGRVAGEDILVATLDSPELVALQPTVTAIDTRPRQAGEMCAQLLFDVIRGEVERGREVSLPLTLVARDSTRSLT
jgi:DNA-binding LacI/PurR family transcriptional regulator